MGGYRFFHISTLLYNSLIRKSMLNLRKLYTENNFKISMCMLVVPALPEQKGFSRKKLSRKGFEPLWFLHITAINLKLYSYQRFIGFKPVPIGPTWKTNWYHKPQNWLMALMTCHRVAYFVLGQQTSEIHETQNQNDSLRMSGLFPENSRAIFLFF